MRSKRNISKKEYGGFIDSDYIEHYENMDLVDNQVQRISSRTRIKDEKSIGISEAKEDPDSGTSDTKKNANLLSSNEAIHNDLGPNKPENSYSVLDKGSTKQRENNQDINDLPVVPTGINLLMIDQHNISSSQKQPPKEIQNAKQQRNHHDYIENSFNESSSIKADLRQNMNDSYPSMPIQNVVPPNPSSVAPVLDEFNSKLLGFNTKSQKVLYKLSEYLNTSQIYSVEKRVELIKQSWITLSSKSQNVLKTLMKNQFNIDLSDFNLDPNCVNSINKMSLNYVRASIIESLYQEIDMLS